MGGYFPGPVGFAAFAGVKFCGYILAGVVLRKLQPTITAGDLKIAAARTGLGIVLGVPMALLGTFVMGFLFPNPGSNLPGYGAYAFLFLVRVLIWALIIFVITKRSIIARSTIWAYAAAGAVWSCLLDLPGIGLAIISPGRIPIC